jgi:hypothetical protein
VYPPATCTQHYTDTPVRQEIVVFVITQEISLVISFKKKKREKKKEGGKKRDPGREGGSRKETESSCVRMGWAC